jgi:hypothetical protein
MLLRFIQYSAQSRFNMTAHGDRPFLAFGCLSGRSPIALFIMSVMVDCVSAALLSKQCRSSDQGLRGGCTEATRTSSD